MLPGLISRPNRASRLKRYSVRPFCWSILLLTLLGLSSWALGRLRHEPVDFILQRLRQRDNAVECRLVRQAEDQCSFIRTNCADDQDGLLSYLELYYCTLADAKPLALIIIILWLSLLFSTIGIAASDFLCIDLSTLASVLGLSESLTGVTFLAFGNGSPDVFSTFAAMRSNSGSLAIGELIGAASFITSVVAGSMALVRPFKVARRSFLRDVGYFVVAVSFSMFLLGDGRLHVWESATMVALYCFYVVLVVTWHWYFLRRRRAYERDLAARSHFHIPDNQELDIEEMDNDDPGVASESTGLLGGEDFHALERSDGAIWREGEEDDDTRNRYLAEIRGNMHVFRPVARRRNTMNPIRPSLVGALEFQSILASLEKSRNFQSIAPPVNLDRSSDIDELASPYMHSDNMSVASHPHASQPLANNRLHCIQARGPTRGRAVSANAAVDLKLDTTLLDSCSRQPLLTIRHPSTDHQAMPSAHQSDYPPQSPNLLAPPDTFRFPTYQSSTSHPCSPLPISPRGTAISTDAPLDSPTSPFPLLVDGINPVSSRASSLRLPPATSPTETLQIQDSVLDNEGNRINAPAIPLTTSWSKFESIIFTLFPTIAGWRSKSIWERLLGVVAAPSVFLLTITLPVIEAAPPIPDAGAVSVVITPADAVNAPAPLVSLPEDSPLLHALDQDAMAEHTFHPSQKSQCAPSRLRFDSEIPAAQTSLDSTSMTTKDWCSWLVWVQLFIGPLFVALITWTAMDPDLEIRNLLLPFLLSLLFSLTCSTALIISTRHRSISQPPDEWRPFLALLGFVVAIFLIATIATEVVNLLKTLGVILNISDSLLGLTVFAVGNSLGDLVADITVARLGYPVMALSACFGGPMLNILLGIGLGGLYMTVNARPEAIAAHGGSYEIEVSKVLIISGATLLITLLGLLVVVPLNGWRMDRKIGWGLVILWFISTLGNVIAEILS
ncbi:sodium/calcium exchanger protein [Aspergillus saccharolyticus JOP 1030-1]|uniref:Sodium/calcium exchanger membrane region domain-containing protein n=1 Tax=Aspergillus saccharolyticus JOP 1030-1 TaxID=1450539 RepID=A0A318Z8F0_9EURO|nr:hypothetical protein BP01DRAFT_375570 [Aspergillus saccharolyticus JOP 1030-1]PYH43439.1 hypothetical protein BP01DRAFT_375570 [Aspergillus saccharolyticus JOP 1030-1]